MCVYILLIMFLWRTLVHYTSNQIQLELKFKVCLLAETLNSPTVKEYGVKGGKAKSGAATLLEDQALRLILWRRSSS